MSESSETKPRPRVDWLAAMLFAGTLGFYAKTVGYSFVNGDDYSFIVENPMLSGHDGFLSLWSAPINHLYAPLTYSLWFLIALCVGIKPWAFHALNVLLHAGATLAVYLVLSRALALLRAQGIASNEKRTDRYYAALGALVFALHPVQAESVAWVSEAKDIFFTLLSLLAIHSYLGYSHARAIQEALRIDQSEKERKRLKSKDSLKMDATASQATRLFAKAFALFLLALLAKPAAVVVPGILFALDTLILDRPWRQSVGGLSSWFGMAAVFALATVTVQPAQEIALVTPLWFRPLVALDTIANYLRHVVAPLGLGMDYGRTPEWLLRNGAYRVTAAAAAITLLGAALLAWKGRAKWLCGGLAIFVLGFIPVSGLVPFDYQQYSTVTDHYLYLPMLGIALVVAVGAKALGEAIRTRAAPHVGRPAIAVIAILALGALAIMSWNQTAIWRGNESLYSATLARNPSSFMSYNNWGQALEADGRRDEALEKYRKAIVAKPGYLPAENNIGNVLFLDGRIDEAIAHYARVISSGEITEPPGHVAARIHNNYAAALAKKGRLSDAWVEVNRAVEIDPNFMEAQANLATLRAAQSGGISK